MNAQRPFRGTIDVVSPADFHDLLPLVRGYCDFYDVQPPDAELLALFEALTTDPAREGLQLLGRGQNSEPLGFATVYWTWSTLHASRIGVMNDLFVIPQARGTGLAEELIRSCCEQCRAHGAALLSWQTAPDNERAQKLYDRIGATREEWIEYTLANSRKA